MRTTYDSRLLPSSYPPLSLSLVEYYLATTTTTTSTILTSSRTSRETAKIKSPSSVKPRPFPFPCLLLSSPGIRTSSLLQKKCQVGIVPSFHHPIIAKLQPSQPASLPSVDSVKKACRHFFFLVCLYSHRRLFFGPIQIRYSS